MKEIIYKLLLITLIAQVSHFSYAALDPSQQTYVLTPEVASMTKYGAYPVSYYTGTPNISIPVHVLKNQDIEIPINLVYDASGFKPNQNDGLCGQGWRLTYGGVISRQVRGFPDDKVTNYGGHDYAGYLSLARGNRLTGRDFIQNVSNYYFYGDFSTLLINGSNFPYYAPDIFTVMLPNGTSFQFMIDNSGIVQVIGGRACKVDLQNVAIQYSGSEIKKSVIIITDEDGYIYEFGGDLSNLEVSYQSDLPNPEQTTSLDVQLATNDGVINGWYLASIKAPNNRTVAAYSYMDTPVSPTQDYPYLQKRISIFEHRGTDLGTINAKNLYFTKMVIPTKITIDNLTVTFSYMISTSSFYGGADSSVGQDSRTYKNKFNKPTYLMTGIKVAYSQHSKEYQFDYKIVDGYSGISKYKSERQFLTSVSILGRKYKFEYNENGLPHPLTKQLDMQMYYNGNQNAKTLLPLRPYMSWETVFNLDFSHRVTNPSLAGTGMLSSITYPTEGITRFVFESHQYSKRVERRKDGQIGFITRDATGYVGGARIKSIINAKGEITEFIYTDDTGKSSGVFNDDGVYACYSKYPFSNREDRELYSISMSSLNLQNEYGEGYIGYTIVKEEKTDWRSNKTITKKMTYTNMLSNPDIILNNGETHVSTKDVYNPTVFTAEMNQFLISSSKALERGLLTGEYFYDDSKLVKTVEFKYSYGSQLKKKYILGATVACDIAAGRGAANAFATYLYSYDLMTRTTKTLLDGVWVAEEYNCVRQGLYNNSPHNMPTRESYSSSKNGSMYTLYLRPLDYGIMTSYQGELARGIFEMQKKNIVSPVIEKIECIYNIEPTSSKYNSVKQSVVKSTITDYRYDNTSEMPLPKYVYESIFPAPISVHIYKKSNVSGGSFNYDSDKFKLTNSYVQYNKYGRLLQKTDITGLTTSYIWGYNNQFLIAKIAGGVCNDMSQIEKLRNRNDLQIQTYTYSPLYGMTSITGTDGVTTYYSYNLYGELITIYRYDNNGKKQIIKAFDYFYEGERR